MKKFVKTLLVMLTFVTSMFFVTGCFGGGGVSGKTYEVVHAEVKSNNPAQQEMLDFYNSRMDGEVGKTVVFEEGGEFGDAGTLNSLYGVVYLNTWSQNGNQIILNGGSDVPQKTNAYLDGDKLIMEMGNINGLLFVYTLEEVAE